MEHKDFHYHNNPPKRLPNYPYALSPQAINRLFRPNRTVHYECGTS